MIGNLDNIAETMIHLYSTIYQDLSEYQVIPDASGSDLQTSKIKLLFNKVSKLNIEDHTVTLADGSVIYYNKVCLQTGGSLHVLTNHWMKGASCHWW